MHNRQRDFLCKTVVSAVSFSFFYNFFNKPGVGVSRIKLFFKCLAELIIYPLLICTGVFFIDMNYFSNNRMPSIDHSWIYGSTILVSFLLIIGYRFFLDKKKLWINNKSTVFLVIIPLGILFFLICSSLIVAS